MAMNGESMDWSHLEWSTEAQPLHEVCKEFLSPMIAKVDDEDLPPSFGTDVDSTLPFVVYSKRKRTKVYAENLVWNKDRKLYEPSGPIIEIPKDYTGWFDVINSHEEAPKHHATIEAIAATECQAFLCCTTVAGFRCKQEDDDLVFSTEIRVYPGEVLRVMGKATKEWKVRDKASADSTPRTIFLKCFDRKKRQVYLPFAHPGKFCVLSENKDQKNAVHQITGLLRKNLPLLVRMVFGWPPPNFKEFTGFMRLIGQNRPDTVVLHNLQATDDKFMVLEVPHDIACQWKKATNMEAVKETKQWKGVIDNCMRKVFPFLITMKCLDVRYYRQAVQAAEGEDNDSMEGDGETQNPRSKMGRMARPLDMVTFNMSDVFPRLVEYEQKMTSQVGLAFKDPEVVLQDTDGKLIDEEVLMTPQVDQDEGEDEQEEEDGEPSELGQVKMRRNKPTRGKRTARQASVVCDTGALRPVSIQGGIPLELTGTIRGRGDLDLQNREASC